MTKNTRKITKIHQAQRDDIADLETWRALPTHTLSMVDPFLFLNHHGFQIYPAKNHGLPFGPHPHRGFETVTFIIEGDIAHADSKGHESVIKAGGIQWMTAGSGVVHSEMSSDEFKQTGGKLEILQLWVNLPSHLKMTNPSYQGFQKEEIPVHIEQDGAVRVQVISGELKSVKGVYQSLTKVRCLLMELKSGHQFEYSIPRSRNVFFYVVRGTIHINDKLVTKRHVVEFDNNGEDMIISATEDAIVLSCDGEPINEPVVSYGPFVMNTKEEIHQAILDYQNGRFTS